MATGPGGGVADYGEPAFGLGGPPAGTARSSGPRLGPAALLLAVAAGAAGITYGVARESGLAALTGRRAVADTSHCRGTRARLCDAYVFAPDGSPVDADATLGGFTRVADNTDVRVRYGHGGAVPDTLPERSAEIALMLVLAGAAVAAALGAGAALVGRGRPAALAAAAVPAAAMPVFAVSLVTAVLAGAPTVSAARLPVPDIYARVAAEPGRTLTAQGVRFELVDNQAMSSTGCFTAPGCVVGAVAHWKVTGTDLVATSHLLAFDGPGSAASTRTTIQQTRALPNAPAPPVGAVVAGIGSGRYASAIWISRADGSSARDDPQTVPALRGLGYFNIDPAVAEGLRSGFKR